MSETIISTENEEATQSIATLAQEGKVRAAHAQTRLALRVSQAESAVGRLHGALVEEALASLGYSERSHKATSVCLLATCEGAVKVRDLLSDKVSLMGKSKAARIIRTGARGLSARDVGALLIASEPTV